MTIFACQACVEAFRSAGGEAAGWAIAFMLLVVVSVMFLVSFSMFRIGLKTDSLRNERHKDLLNDK